MAQSTKTKQNIQKDYHFINNGTISPAPEIKNTFTQSILSTILPNKNHNEIWSEEILYKTKQEYDELFNLQEFIPPKQSFKERLRKILNSIISYIKD